MALATLNNVSALDTIAGPYSPGWSQAGFTSQQLVSASQVAATGGTYAIIAPVAEPVIESAPMITAKVRAPRKTASKKAVTKEVPAEVSVKE